MDEKKLSYKERFISDYIKHASMMLDITDPAQLFKMRGIVEKAFTETDMYIYNTDKYTGRYLDVPEFWYERGKYVLNENGVLFDTTARNESVTASLIAQNIELRQVFKKAKKKASEIGDSIAEKKHGTFEALTKLMINGSTMAEI